MESHFDKVVIPKVPNLIIEQIMNKIVSDELKPGQRLPSESQLQEFFSVTRLQLKSAFKRMEEYGIVETKPQSGTFIASFGKKILEGLLANVLQMDEQENNPLSLIDTRNLFEIRAVELAAQKITPAKLEQIQRACDTFVKHAHKDRGIDDDIYFHLMIINAAESPALAYHYCVMTPALINFYKDLNSIDMVHRLEETFVEHEAVIKALRNHDAAEAVKAMKTHTKNTYATAERLAASQGSGA